MELKKTHSFPQGFEIRRPTFLDIPRVFELLQQAEGGTSEITEEVIRRIWTSSEVDVAQDIWLIFASSGQLVAYLHLEHTDPLHMRVVVRIHPEYVSSELRRALLTRAETRAWQVLSTVRSNTCLSLHLWYRGSDQAYRQDIEQAGFVHIRSNWRMEIEMSEPPPPPRFPEGVELRPFTSRLARTVHAVSEEAFRDVWSHSPEPFETFEHWYMSPPTFDPTLWFLPFQQDNLVGAVLCECKDGRGWVYKLGVLPAFRCKGLGLALLHHAFGAFYRRGEGQAALYVDTQSLTGAPRLYERAGMHVVRRDDLYEKQLCAGKEAE